MKTNEQILELLAKNINPLTNEPFYPEYATAVGIDVNIDVDVIYRQEAIKAVLPVIWPNERSAVATIADFYRQAIETIQTSDYDPTELVSTIINIVYEIYGEVKEVTEGKFFVPHKQFKGQVSGYPISFVAFLNGMTQGPDAGCLTYNSVNSMIGRLINPHTGYMFTTEYFYGFGAQVRLCATVTKSNDPHFRWSVSSKIINGRVQSMLKDMFPRLTPVCEGYMDYSSVKVYDSLVKACRIIRARIAAFTDGDCTMDDVLSEFSLQLDKQLTITYHVELPNGVPGVTTPEKPKDVADLTPMELIAKFFPGQTIRFIHGPVPVFMRTRVGHESELVIKVKRKGRPDGQVKMVVKPGTTRIEAFTEILGNIGYLLKDEAAGLIDHVHHAAATAERRLDDKHLNLIATEGNLEGRFIQPGFHCRLTEDLELFFEFAAVITMKVKKEEKPLETMTELMTGFNGVNELNGKVCIGVFPIGSVVTHNRFVQLAPGKLYADILEELVEVVTKETRDSFLYLQDDRWLKDFLLFMVQNNLALGMELPVHNFSVTFRDDKYALDVTACLTNPF